MIITAYFSLHSAYIRLYCRPVHAFFMPKMKSHSGAKKRIRKTGSGKLAMKRAGRNHLLQQKGKRQKALDRTTLVHPSNLKAIKGLTPYL